MNSLSVSGKNWILKKYNQDNLSYIKEFFSLDEITSKLLSIRNIKKEEINSFLNPSIKNFIPNPNNLVDMKKTTLKAVNILEKSEKIGIFGDYDVDGASSTALLGNYFSQLGLDVEIYIPDRKKDGYGPSIKSFKDLIDKRVKVIFTVDCGTLSFEAINYANKKNIDVIVLDHHQSEIKLPNAYSIVNPNRFDDKSNLQYLCAAGVSFMFLVSLNRELRSIGWFKKKNIEEPNLLDSLDLVSLGTVCDVVPLIGLNRAIVKQGLKVIKSKKNLGLKTLLDICKIDSHPSVYHIGYMIGPRINAGGRVGKCSHGANLLLNKNPKESFKLASELDQFNKERQVLEKELLEKILNQIKKISK
jgi:single-stranded-DNA-specific exonuclease